MDQAALSILANSLAVALAFIIGQSILIWHHSRAKTESLIITLIGTLGVSFVTYYIIYRMFGLVPMGSVAREPRHLS